MFQRFEINSVHADVDAKLKAYVTKKIGGLDRYVSRHSRESAHAEVHLKEAKAKKKDRFTCEVTLHLPHQNIVVKESAVSMYAAVDIVETKLKKRLQKYKETHQSGKMHRRLFGRIKGKISRR